MCLSLPCDIQLRLNSSRSMVACFSSRKKQCWKGFQLLLDPESFFVLSILHAAMFLKMCAEASSLASFCDLFFWTLTVLTCFHAELGGALISLSQFTQSMCEVMTEGAKAAHTTAASDGQSEYGKGDSIPQCFEQLVYLSIRIYFIFFTTYNVPSCSISIQSWVESQSFPYGSSS